MLFRLWAQMGPRNRVLDVDPDCPSKGAIFRGKGMHRHARRHCCKLCKNDWTYQDTVWVVDLGGPKEACFRWGAHRRHLANTTEQSTCGGDAAFLSNYFDHLLSSSSQCHSLHNARCTRLQHFRYRYNSTVFIAFQHVWYCIRPVEVTKMSSWI